MSNKRSAALSAISGPSVAPPAEPVASTPVAAELSVAAPAEKVVALPNAAPKVGKAIDKVMLYLPSKVARKFKEMAFHEDRRVHDLYLRALETFLRQEGHVTEANLLKK